VVSAKEGHEVRGLGISTYIKYISHLERVRPLIEAIFNTGTVTGDYV
jgi:hypothetical protein